MHVAVFQGYLGAGKTSGMVLFAKYLQAITKQTYLYSNFGVLNSIPFTRLEDFKEVAKNESNLVLLDEAHADLDSRSFSTNHVKFVSQTSFYLRKMNCTLMLTSPLYDSLDSRIRGITNYLFDVSSDKKYFYYEIYDIQSEKHLKSLRIRKDFAFQFNLFNTNAVVTPLEVPEKREQFNQFLLDLKTIIEERSESQKRISVSL